MVIHELALFAGAGGGILGGKLLGWRTVCAVEINAYCTEVLLRRQEEGHLEPFPVWDDICTFDGAAWAGKVDVISGGFPCQDISWAGKGAGISGSRSGLWSEMARVVREVGPRYVFVENVPALTHRGLGVVLGDLAQMGYDARWCVLGARHVGAPHKRDRIWILGYTHEYCESAGTINGDKTQQLQTVAADPNCLAKRKQQKHLSEFRVQTQFGDDRSPQFMAHSTLELLHWPRMPGAKKRQKPKDYGSRVGVAHADSKSAVGTPVSWEAKNPWTTEPDVGRVAHGVAARMDQLRAIGNGQVPQVVKLAWEILNEIQY